MRTWATMLVMVIGLVISWGDISAAFFVLVLDGAVGLDGSTAGYLLLLWAAGKFAVGCGLAWAALAVGRKIQRLRYEKELGRLSFCLLLAVSTSLAACQSLQRGGLIGRRVADSNNSWVLNLARPCGPAMSVDSRPGWVLRRFCADSTKSSKAGPVTIDVLFPTSVSGSSRKILADLGSAASENLRYYLDGTHTMIFGVPYHVVYDFNQKGR